jgi:Flp pilus assembly protein CpaB
VFPTLTFARRRVPSRRLVAAGVGGILLTAAVAGPFLNNAATPSVPAPSNTLTQRLEPSTWALSIPTAWLGAPLPQAQPGDHVDLLAVRQGEHPLAIAVAAGLRVMAVDDRAVVFEVDEDSAAAIATARASGLLIVPLLRSTR